MQPLIAPIFIAPPSQENVAPAVGDAPSPPMRSSDVAATPPIARLSSIVPRKNAHVCPVCKSPNLDEINIALHERSSSQRQIARAYLFSARQISNHGLNCLHLQPQTREEAARMGGRRAAANAGCKICTHPEVDAINVALHAGTPAATLARTYASHPMPFGDKAVATHKAKHLGLKPLPRGNYSGKIRGRAAAALAAKTAAAIPFAGHVATEIARLGAERDRLSREVAALGEEQQRVERLYMALRAFQEVAADAS